MFWPIDGCVLGYIHAWACEIWTTGGIYMVIPLCVQVYSVIKVPLGSGWKWALDQQKHVLILGLL